MSAELPLSTRILLVLNPSIFNNNQRVVVGLFHSSGIGFIEGHVLVRPSMFERWYHMDAIHLSLAFFIEESE